MAEQNLSPEGWQENESEDNPWGLDSPTVPRNVFRPPRRGSACPICQKGRLDYDSMLNLRCPDCGYTLAGCFT